MATPFDPNTTGALYRERMENIRRRHFRDPSLVTAIEFTDMEEYMKTKLLCPSARARDDARRAEQDRASRAEPQDATPPKPTTKERIKAQEEKEKNMTIEELQAEYEERERRRKEKQRPRRR